MSPNPIALASLAISRAQEYATDTVDNWHLQCAALRASITHLGSQFASYQGRDAVAGVGCTLAFVTFGGEKVLVEFSYFEYPDLDDRFDQYGKENIDVLRLFVNGRWVDVGPDVFAEPQITAWQAEIAVSARDNEAEVQSERAIERYLESQS